jgi:hypothetical protein
VDAGRRAGASSTATWLALAVRRSTKSTHYRARLARDLLEHPEVEHALTRGEVDLAQARAILDETRPVAPAGRAAAVAGLVAAAGVLGADSLRVEGRRTLRAVADVPVAPEASGIGETAAVTPYVAGPQEVEAPSTGPTLAGPTLAGPTLAGPTLVGPPTAGPDDPRPVVDPPGEAAAPAAEPEGGGQEAPGRDEVVRPGPVLTMRTCPAAAVGPRPALDLEDDTSEPFVCGRFVIPTAVAAQLREALQALVVADDPGGPADSDLGRAFCALIARSAAQDPTTAAVPRTARRTARRRLRLRSTGRRRVAATA